MLSGVPLLNKSVVDFGACGVWGHETTGRSATTGAKGGKMAANTATAAARQRRSGHQPGWRILSRLIG